MFETPPRIRVPSLPLMISVWLCWLAIAPTPEASASPRLLGTLTSVRSDSDGNAVISGWACNRDDDNAVAIHLYAALPYPAGQITLAGTANKPAPAAAQECGTPARYGFELTLPSAQLLRYGGLRLFGYAVLAGRGVTELTGSGSFRFPEYAPYSAPRSCSISDTVTLKACFSKPGSYEAFVFERDLACTSESDCCGDNGAPLIRLQNVSGKVIDGNGHFLRRAKPLACNAVEFDGVHRVVLRNLSIDEDERVPPCGLHVRNCPNTVFVNTSADVQLDNVHVYFGKGYVVRVWHTDGFAFVRSSLAESGIIGLYVGHFKYGASTDVVIADSIIARSRTNGIALQGAVAAGPASPVLVIDSVLNANHWHGLWPVPGIRGGITSGGQLLIADGANIRVSGNIEADALCERCKPPQTVAAIEVADQAPPPGGVRGLIIDHNTLLNGAGVAIYQNPGSSASDVVLEGNRIIGYRSLDSIKAAATRKDNVLQQPASGVSRSGAATYEILRLAADGTHYSAILPAEHPGARVEAVFALSPSPRPGAPWRPLLRCDAGTRQVVVAGGKCEGGGQVDAVLGYSLAATDPGARPFFACAASATDQFLSWDPACGGRETLGQLGYARPKSAPTPMPRANP
jgi:hypothetical protein